MEQNDKNKVYLPDIYKAVAKKTDITIADSRLVCDAFLDEIMKNIFGFKELIFSKYFAILPKVRKGRQMIKYDGKVVKCIDRPLLTIELSTINKDKLRKKFNKKNGITDDFVLLEGIDYDDLYGSEEDEEEYNADDGVEDNID